MIIIFTLNNAAQQITREKTSVSRNVLLEKISRSDCYQIFECFITENSLADKHRPNIFLGRKCIQAT